MISAPTWVTANGAQEYLTESKDNYYQKEGTLGEWIGKLADDLGYKSGLINEITPDDLKNALWGKSQNGNAKVQARTDKNGDRIRAAVDLTFSAPKSVSIMLELARAINDKELANKLINAHQNAVNNTLDKIEQLVQSRQTHNGQTQTVQTGKALIGTFIHDVSRPVTDEKGNVTVDPSLHTHSIVMNMTKLDNGEYRAIETQKIMDNYIKLGQQYRNDLASNLKELGYEIKVTDAKKGFFELKQIDEKAIVEFSKRSEQANDEDLIKKLKTKYPGASESEIKQMAVYATREWKGKIDRHKVTQDNLKRAEELGIDIKKALAPTLEIKNLTQDEKEQLKSEELASAKEAVINATKALSDETSIFEKNDILQIAGKFALKDGLSSKVLENAINEQQKTQETGSQLINFKEDFYITKEMLEKERAIISALKQENEVMPVFSKTGAKNEVDRYSKFQEDKTGFGLTSGQIESTELILSSSSQIIGVQGDAGTGKTTMLKAVNELSQESGIKLFGLSYTGKAASEIEKATASEITMNEAGIESSTIASFLLKIENLTDSEKINFQNTKLIIDEASMIGTKDTYKLVRFAQETGSQLIFMGDLKQFKSITAGDMFKLMQDNGMQTAQMNQVLRQKDRILKSVVKELNGYNTDEAFKILDDAGKIKEVQDDKIFETVKDNYFKNHQEDQVLLSDKDIHKNNLILTNTNKIKDELNQTIRENLKKENLIAAQDILFSTKESNRLSPSQKYMSENYSFAGEKKVNKDSILTSKGDLIFLQDDIADLKKGSEFRVIGRNDETNTITVMNEEVTNPIEINLNSYGHAIQSYTEKERSFSVGEKIVFEKNDKKLGVKNGNTAEILSIENGNIVVKMDEGQKIGFNINEYSYLNHGYAVTNHKAQGQTSKNVIAVMDAKAQNFNSFYVAATRAVENLTILTNDKEMLQDKINLNEVKYNYHDFDKVIAQESKERESLKNKRVERKANLTNTLNTGKITTLLKKEDVKSAAKEIENIKENLSDAQLESLENKLNKTAKQKSKKNYTRLTTDEVEKLKQMTIDELRTTHPGPVLESLGIPYAIKYGRVVFKSHVEKHASSNLYIDKGTGEWKFKNFGTGSNGTIENAVMEITGMTYKDALNYSIGALGIPNYLEQRFTEIKKENEPKTPLVLKQEYLKKIKKLKKENLNFAKETSSNSHVIKIEEIKQDDNEVIAFLRKRGVEKVPDGFYKITGQFNVKDKSYQNIGIGVLTGETKNSHNLNLQTVGADIHLLKPINKQDGSILKTLNFGNKDITLLNNKEDNQNIAVFESKMDYAAAFSQNKEEFQKTTTIIANGTGNFFKVAQKLIDIKVKDKELTFYNQNDAAGSLFVEQIAENSHINRFNYIKYDESEKGQDVNDLIKNKREVASRIKKGQSLDDFKQESMLQKLKKKNDIIKDKINVNSLQNLNARNNKDIRELMR